MAKDLTKKQRVFVAEYLIDQNATRAAVAAGYSKKTAQEQGSRLLSNVMVAAEISKKLGKKLEKLEITADRVLGEIAKLAFLDPRKFYDASGNLKPIHELDDDTAACLAGLEVNEITGEEGAVVGYAKKIKFADKGINLERLGKHLKLFTDKVDLSGSIDLPTAERTARIATLVAEAARRTAGK